MVRPSKIILFLALSVILSIGVIGVIPAYAAATVVSTEFTGITQATIVFSVPVDWVISDFTNLAGDVTGTLTVSSISETAPSSTVTITFTGGPVNTFETGHIDIAAISDIGSGNTFVGLTNHVLTDAIPPSLDSVQTKTTTTIDVTFSEALSPASVANTDFSVAGNSVTAVSVSGSIVTLTLSSPIFTDATPDVTLGGDGVNDTSGNNQSASTAVTPTDGIPPNFTISPGGASVISTTTILVGFSEAVNGTFSTSNWDVSGNIVTGISPSGFQSSPVFSVTLTVSTPISTNATPTVTYTPGDLADSAEGNAMASQVTTVTDSIDPQVDTTEPVSVFFADSISFFFTENIFDNSVSAGDFTVNGILSTPNVVFVSFGSAAVTLSLDNSITTSDTAITLNYTKTTGSIDDSNGNQLQSFGPIVVTNAAPVLTDSTHTDTTTTLHAVFDTDLDGTTVAASDFAVSGFTVTGASEFSSGEVLLTVTPSMPTDATPTISIIGSVTDVIGFVTSSGSKIAIDKIHPEFVSATTFSDTRVDVTFSENMAIAGVTASDFKITGTLANGPITVNSIAVSTTDIQLSLSAALTDTDLINVSYTGTGTAPTDSVLIPLFDFGSQSVTNTLTSAAPTVISAQTTSTTSIDLTMSEVVFNSGAIPSDFTISGVASNPSVTSFLVSGNTISLSLSSKMTNLDTPTVTYVDDSTTDLDIHNAADIELASFTNLFVTNNVPAAPTVISAQTTSTTSIDLTMSETVVDNGVSPSDFTISGVASLPSVTSVLFSGNIITLNLTSEMTNLDTPTVSYVDDGTGDITNAAVISLDSFTNLSVTNNISGVAPTAISAETTSTTSIDLTISEVVFDNGAAPSDFTISGVASNPSVTSFLVSGNTISLSLSSKMTNLDTPTVSYVDSTTEFDIENGDGKVRRSSTIIENNFTYCKIN